MKKNYLAIAIASAFLLTSCGGTSDSSGNVENRINEMDSNQKMLFDDAEMFALNKNQCVNKHGKKGKGNKGKKGKGNKGKKGKGNKGKKGKGNKGKKGKGNKGPKNPVAQAWLRSHNVVRRRHRAPNLKWSNKLAQSAQAFANTCSNGHSNSQQYGENLAFASYRLKPKAVVGIWYKESAQYDYNNPGFGMNTGHFTQVVWRNTKFVGCGQAKCGWNNVTVCQYYPAGNMYGRFPNNVYRPTR